MMDTESSLLQLYSVLVCHLGTAHSILSHCFLGEEMGLYLRVSSSVTRLWVVFPVSFSSPVALVLSPSCISSTSYLALVSRALVLVGDIWCPWLVANGVRSGFWVMLLFTNNFVLVASRAIFRLRILLEFFLFRLSVGISVIPVL